MLFIIPLFATPVMAQSLTDTAVALPTWSEIRDVVLLRDYNARTVVLGATCLGLAAGMIGTFMLLRKRALLGDALSHATLPGIAIAFMIMVALGGSGKWLPGLLVGATVTGLLGVGWILVIRSFTRLKEDAALGIVLSVFFGVGVALMGIIQTMQRGNAAGLEGFIFGKTASMLRSDAQIIAAATLAVAVVCALLFKEFTLLCFDTNYAATQGWPVVALDLTLMAFVTAVTVIGLQAVGLILIIALLIIPPAAARFWTEHLHKMLVISAILGALSGLVGAMASALVPRLPAGAIIVVAASALFVASMFFGTARGILVRWLRHQRTIRRIGEQHLLRGLYELAEPDEHGKAMTERPIPIESLMRVRSWSRAGLSRLIRRAERDGLVVRLDRGHARLTELGFAEAWRMVRNHRLWEMYLITHADVAPSHVDRDADLIEHVVGREMVAKLESLVEKEDRAARVPSSPHPIT